MKTPTLSLTRPLIWTLGGLALFAYLLGQYFLSSLERRLEISTLTGGGRGLSVFQQLAATAPASGGQIIGSALLSAEVLAGIDTLVIASPVAAVSKHEADIVAAFVAAGGRLIISFHDAASFSNLRDLTVAVDGDFKQIANASFKDFSVERIVAPPLTDSRELVSGSTYAFYSPVILNNEGCKKHRLQCYYAEWSYVDGSVTLMAGLPLFANALLARDDNGDFAARLLTHSGVIAFDEYHHFFSAKTWFDLAGEPRFFLPLLGLLLVVLAFMGFGPNALQPERAAAGLVVGGRSYHDLNTRVLAGVLNSEGRLMAATGKQSRFLHRRFPEFVTEPPPATNAEATAQFLIRAHATILQRKGRIPRP